MTKYSMFFVMSSLLEEQLVLFTIVFNKSGNCYGDFVTEFYISSVSNKVHPEKQQVV